MDEINPTDLHARDRADRLRSAQAHRAARQERSDIAWLMSGPRGRRIVWGILERAGVFRVLVPGDLSATAFAEGCRNEGLRWLSSVFTLPEFQKMVEENAPKPEPDQSAPDEATIQ